MDPAIDAALEPSDLDDLRDLTSALLRAAGLPRDAASVEHAVTAALAAGASRPWTAVLDDVADRVGLSVRARVATPAEAATDVRPGQPVVGRVSGRWWLLEDRGGRVRRRLVGGGAVPVPEAPATWLSVAAVLPAAVLADADHAPPFRRLVRLLAAEHEDLRTGLVFALTAGLLGLATPVAVQVFVNTVAFGTVRQPLVALLVVLLACLGLEALLRVLQRIAAETLQRRVFVRLVADLAERLPRLHPQVGEQQAVPQLVNRFFDVLTVQKSLASLLIDGLASFLQALVGMTLLAVYHPALLGFDLVLLGAIVAVLSVGWRRGVRTAVEESHRKYDVAAWLEGVAGAPARFALGAGPSLAAREADLRASAWVDARASHFRGVVAQIGGAYALQATAAVALLGLGGWLVLEGQLTVGQLVAAELVVGQAVVGVTKLATKLESVYDLLAAVDKLGHLADLPLDDPGGDVALPAGGPVAVRLEGVRADADGDAIDLDVAAGARRAVLVERGSRRRLAEVVAGLYPPIEGRVSVAGTPRDALRTRSLRAGVALLRGELDPSEDAELDEATRTRRAVDAALAAAPRLVVVDGLLDARPRAERAALLDALASDPAPWTLVVLTHDPAVAASVEARRAAPVAPAGGGAS